MVDTVDSKSTAFPVCGFESHLPYHLRQSGLIQFIRPFLFAFIGFRVSYVLDIINKDSSNNDIFYNECVLVVVLFVKRFDTSG